MATSSLRCFFIYVDTQSEFGKISEVTKVESGNTQKLKISLVMEKIAERLSENIDLKLIFSGCTICFREPLQDEMAIIRTNKVRAKGKVILIFFGKNFKGIILHNF